MKSATLAVLVLATSLSGWSLTVPANAVKSSKHYRESGVGNGTGRSGSAHMTARALLDKDGQAVVEVTTGALDSTSTPPGSFRKLQFKALSSAGDPIRSGTVNIGDPVVVEVTRPAGDSTYAKIVELVQQAQDEKAPLVRLADRYSTVFTLLTLVIAACAYLLAEYVRGADGPRAVLSVLVTATPCPLILATPIALLGGVNAAARKKIIVKSLASLETLSRIDAIIFDKTGTITLGRPRVTEMVNLSDQTDAEILGIVEAIERSSLHPLAKALVEYAREHARDDGDDTGRPAHATEVREEIGRGISGLVGGRRYTLCRLQDSGGMAILISARARR